MPLATCLMTRKGLNFILGLLSLKKLFLNELVDFPPPPPASLSASPPSISSPDVSVSKLSYSTEDGVRPLDASRAEPKLCACKERVSLVEVEVIGVCFVCEYAPGWLRGASGRSARAGAPAR